MRRSHGGLASKTNRPRTRTSTGWPSRRALSRLIDQLALNFATADFIVTPAGGVVFLEVNTISGYAFTERAGLPISAAIADLLLGRAPRRG